MSAAISTGAAQAPGAPDRAGTRARPAAARLGLRLVPGSSSRPARAPFVLAVLTLLAGGLIGLLLLNTVLAQDAFRLHDLQRTTALLTDSEQELQQELALAQSPAELARRATALGMVPGGDVTFRRLPDGRVVGQVAPAPLPPPPAPVAKPGAKPTAKPGAKPGTKPTAKPATRPPTRPAPTAKPTTKPTAPAPGGHR